MTKRLCLSLALAVVATLLVVMPVLAAYYAYIYVEESDGNSYENLPVSVPCNTTILIQGDFMTSTALDTRVLTGSGEALPHMVADDKVMFVTDLEAYEKKTLIFYLGATSLSSFPIIVGHNGSFETPDDPDLELGYVMELLVSGYFNAETEDIGHNILYKEDALRIWISAEHTLKVATYNSTGDEQWEMHYSSFTTGDHIVYVLCNGLGASLFVDDFVTAKDTQNLYEANYYQLSTTYDTYMFFGSGSYQGGFPRTFYAQSTYWAFYTKSTNATEFFYKTAPDGATWSSEYSFTAYGTETHDMWSVWFDPRGYMHIVYPYKAGTGDGATDYVRYRMGAPEANSTITWASDWQLAATDSGVYGVTYSRSMVVADPSGYPSIFYLQSYLTPDHVCYVAKSTTNNGTFTAGGGLLSITNNGHIPAPVQWLVQYPNSTKAYYIYSTKGPSQFNYVKGRYFNGAAWAGADDTLFYDGTSLGYVRVCGVADNADNLYLFWYDGGDGYIYMKIRYADGSWSSTIQVAAGGSPTASYNTDKNVVYIFYLSGGYIKASVVDMDEGTLKGPYTIAAFTAGTYNGISSTPYETEHFGILFATSSGGTATTAHASLWFSWEWNDNNNDWYWNQNNTCPYIDDIQMAVDGELQLEYKPDSIIQGTTLPDEENSHDATINWGANPVGVNTSMSALQFEQSYNETYYYQYLAPGSTDIIKPEPEGMGGDVDLDRLHDNPLYPLVQVLTIAGFLTERLVWLGLAWLIVIAAMFLVHLGPDTHKDSEKPQHFILTTVTGLGLSILFYTMGIFPLWVIILMAFGFVGAIIWERQPVL